MKRTVFVGLVIVFFATIFLTPASAQDFSRDWDTILLAAEGKLSTRQQGTATENAALIEKVRRQIRELKGNCSSDTCWVQIKKSVPLPEADINEDWLPQHLGGGKLLSVYWRVWTPYSEEVTREWRSLGIIKETESLLRKTLYHVYLGACDQARRKTSGFNYAWIDDHEECVPILTPDEEERLFSTLPEAELTKVRMAFTASGMEKDPDAE